MAHHKRTKRRRAAIKGHCGMCQMQSGKGRNGDRELTPQERQGKDSAVQQLADEHPLVHPAEDRLWDEDAFEEEQRSGEPDAGFVDPAWQAGAGENHE